MRALLSAFFVSANLAAQAPVAVPDDATADQVVALAGEVRPSPRQLAWQATGFNAFVHFGMNTFTDREWGDGTESPTTFAPTGFDAGQWARTFRDAGMRGLVLTCKHHDGFCLWPSATTGHDVTSSPFRGGAGDVVGEVAAACREHGLRFGVYLSPWDRNQKTFGTKAYQKVFLQQLRELCTGYGELFEVWFDGAHCPPDDPEVFDWQAVFELVRELQPNAVIAITGPDVRWVGNEAGVTRGDEWSVLPLPEAAPGPFASDRQSWRSLWALRARNQAQDLGSRDRLRTARALCWWPAETDVSIRPGWFYHAHEDAEVKPFTTLLDYWFTAVGGNAVLLLNVPADRRGRIADADARVLRDVGRYLQATFDDDLTRAGDVRNGEVHFDEPVTVDLFDLREDVGNRGQRIEEFSIDVLDGSHWREWTRGTTVGFRRLLRTDAITSKAFRFRVERSRGDAAIASFGLYRRPPLLRAPTMRRLANGDVLLDAGGLPVRYTTDGTAVTAQSPRYREPFALPAGGTVRARAFAPAANRDVVLGTASETSRTFGLARLGWGVLDCSSEQADKGEGAANAIDGDPDTIWHTRYAPDTPEHPHHLTIDLGAAHDLTGFVYVPRKGGGNGTIAAYEFFGSADGVTFTSLAEGTFGNIANNPTARTVQLPKRAEGTRYVRLVARREADGKPWASVAELSVLVR
ncbi:MAG: alpha-L-fucosidase [Planctomycetota bacterium]